MVKRSELERAERGCEMCGGRLMADSVIYQFLSTSTPYALVFSSAWQRIRRVLIPGLDLVVVAPQADNSTQHTTINSRFIRTSIFTKINRI